ncbi:MAG: hypothetical protein K8R21_02745 [Leptospira sp.]|nr:hypothetical protein [Leptospira sp.]
MNTGARVLGRARELNRMFLISESEKNHLKLSDDSCVEPGERALKGKDLPLRLYSLQN